VFWLRFPSFEFIYILLFGMKPGGEAIPLWQHPLRVLFFHSIYVISPALVKPVIILILLFITGKVPL
jgi:hypothetical protein